MESGSVDRRGRRNATAAGPAEVSVPALVPRLAAGAAAGAGWVLALPPVDWWLCAPVALTVLLLALRGLSPLRRSLVGAVAGLVVFGVTLRWAIVLTPPGFVLLVLSQAAFVASAACSTPARRGAVLAFPGVLVLSEWARHRWPLSGLPLSGLDVAQAGSPLLPAVSVGGPLLLVRLVAAVASGLAYAVRRRTVRWSGSMLAVALGIYLVAVPQEGSWTRAEGRPLAVALVQGGGERGIPAVRSDAGAVFARHVSASARIEQPVDLIVWPEDVVDVDSFARSEERAELARLAQATGAVVVAGVVEDAVGSDPEAQVRRFYNRAVAIEATGDVGAVYDKVIRVPFGEYVPWRTLVDRVADLSLVPREAVPGAGPGILGTSVGRLGVAISFEGLFASRARGAVRSGADILVNPTNAASYVTPDVPSQQVASAKLRAVETGRWVLVAGPTGPSAIVDADGRVRIHSDLEEQTVPQSPVERRSGVTPYVRFGDAPIVGLGAVMTAAGWWRSRDPTAGPRVRRSSSRLSATGGERT